MGCVLSTQSFTNVGDEAIRDRLLGAGSVICYQGTEKDARMVAGAFRPGLRLVEDWREEITRHGVGPYRYETSALVYHRPLQAEIADRLACLRTLVGIGRSLVRTNDGEYVVATPDMDRAPGGAVPASEPVTRHPAEAGPVLPAPPFGGAGDASCPPTIWGRYGGGRGGCLRRHARGGWVPGATSATVHRKATTGTPAA